jgi:molecular chaperone IbpA
MKGEMKMTNQPLTIGRIDFSPFTRLTVGFDEIFDQLARSHEQLTNNNVNYPPYNIVKYDTNQYGLEIAVAGFEIEEIDIGVEGNNLTISGEKSHKEDDVTTYIYKGISTRSFKRTIPLGEHIVVKDALIKNGMLTIKLERELPESLKPRKIAITSLNK